MCEYCGCQALASIEELTREHVLDVDATPVDRTWPQRFLDKLDMLREHILKEQDGVFPAALATLSTTDWEAVEAARARAREGHRSWTTA